MQRKLNFLFIIVLSFVMSSALSAQTLLDETFNYTVGDLLTAHGWTAHSGAGTNSAKVTTPALTYTGFVNSGVGNATALGTSGEDVNKRFSTDSIVAGNIYASFLVNVTSALTGDYFFHFTSNNAANGLYYARVYIKKASNGNIAFGINKRNTAAAIKYTDTVTSTYTLNTTYLVVVKYAIAAGADNDTVSLWVNPTLSTTEPTPTLVETDATTGTDAVSLATIALRQGSATLASALALSGIHVAKTWDLGGTPTTSLALTSPVGAENWVQASNHNITWTSTNVTNVKLEFSTDGGSSYTTIIASTPAAAGSYAWTVPSVVTTSAKVRISDVASVATPATSAAFTVSAAATPTLALTSPAGGENWIQASNHNITWTSTLVTNVKLEFSTDGGSSYTDIIASTPAAAGSYAWTVPTVSTTNSKVRISDVASVATPSTSAVFTIASAPSNNTIAAARALAVGTKVTVTGIVTSPNFHATKNSFYIQDATGGIDVFGGTLVTTALGDSVVATGWLLMYNNLLELSDSISTAVSLAVTNVSSGHIVPAPKVISIAELNTNGEKYEGQLITVKNVTKTAGTWPAANGASVTLTAIVSGNTTDALAIRITKPSELTTGVTEPVWPKDVTGIATQFTTTTGGYQLTPRFLADFATITAVQNESNNSNTVIKGFGLSQNYPNPFNPTTNINYNLDKPGVVTLKVYNVLGNEVASLVNEYKSAGNYNVNFNAANLTSGVYLYKLQVGAQSVTKKLTLMK